MTPHVTDLLPELALGSLPDDDRATVKRHVSDCTDCAGELDAINETLAELLLGLEPVTPNPAVLERVLSSCERGRFARFADAMARIFDVTEQRARELLDMVDDPSAWEPGPTAGASLIHFTAGPACAGADNGFVRVAPGLLFPWHSHNGTETNLVLQSSCVDSDGTMYRRGDQFVHEAGSAHDFTAAAGTSEFIYAVSVLDGVDWDAPRPTSKPE